MLQTTAPSAVPRPLTGSQVGIPPRHVNFEFAPQAPKYFLFDNNPFASLLFVVLSAGFPPGEKFFMDSVRHFRDQVKDPVLKAQVSGFMGQEAIHTREHRHLNDLYRAHGIDVDLAERSIAFGLRQLERFSPRLQLACTTLMEHFTAHLAEVVLTHRDLPNNSDTDMLQLWRWHSLEELEHKTVAYDVFQLIGGTLKERKQAAWLVSLFVLPTVLWSWFRLLMKDGQLFNRQENRRGRQALFGRRGLVSRVLKHMPKYWQPGFHPSQQSTQELELAWRERLFGTQGELRSIYSNANAA